MRALKSLGTALTAALVYGSTLTTAFAHWQFTKWGMSPDQVVEASNGTAQTHLKISGSSADDYDHLSSGEYSSTGFDFQVHFLFRRQTGRLEVVNLMLNDSSKCRSLFATLKLSYGKPIQEIDEPGVLRAYVFRDLDAMNQVNAIAIGGLEATTDCVVQYREIVKPGSGL